MAKMTFRNIIANLFIYKIMFLLISHQMTIVNEQIKKQITFQFRLMLKN